MNDSKPKRILRLPDVKVRAGLGTTALYSRMREGAFPRPVSLGGRAVGWLESDIDDWIESRVATSRSAEPLAA
jgi:prophage regulatory protein